MRKLFKIISILLGVIALFISIPQLILAYPNFLFKEKCIYKNFVILSDKKIEQDLNKRLDAVSYTLAKTGFYERDKKIKIIFCYDNGLTSFFDRISLAPSGAGFQHFTGNIYLFNARIERFRKENSKAKGEHQKIIEYSYQEFELDHILTHEILHKLHSDTLGLWKFKRKMPPPHWKAEGFAEYYTYHLEKVKDKNYDFRKRVNLYLKYKDEFPLFYYKSQLLYEYLSEYEQLSFSDIMQDDVTEEQTFNKLIQWYKLYSPEPDINSSLEVRGIFQLGKRVPSSLSNSSGVLNEGKLSPVLSWKEINSCLSCSSCPV